MKTGNAEQQAVVQRAMGQVGNFYGKIGQFIWPTLKQEILSGRIDLAKLSDTEIKQAIRRGFFVQPPNQKLDLGLNIGKVSKDELADLSIWDLKKLYSLYYQQVYGLFVDFPDELMPEASDEFAWPVCRLGIISAEASFNGGKLNLPRCKWTDKVLDSVLKLDLGRDAWIHSFIVRVRPNWEADEDLKNLSGNDIENKRIDVLMLPERLELGNFLNWLTGDYLDRNTITLTGSRYTDGLVPGVHQVGDKVDVDRYLPRPASDRLRFRQAVSSSPKAEER